MTEHKAQKKNVTEPTFFQYTLGLMTVFCLMLLLKNSAIAMKCVGHGLHLCAKTVIPSLFPFMVISELIVTGGIYEMIPDILTKPLRQLLYLPSAGCIAVLMGVLCGFPVGARCAVLALRRGLITRAECERVLGCASIPSAAFLINVVGVSLFQSRSFGVALYVIAVVSALLCGSLLRPKTRSAAPPKSPDVITSPPCRGAALLTESIKGATAATLSICAYVIFFCAITGTVSEMLTRLSLPPLWCVLLSSALELSGGAERAASLASPTLAALMSAATIGWSGLSVHCQLIALCEGQNLSYRPYFWAKLLQCLLCVLLCGAALFLLPDLRLG